MDVSALRDQVRLYRYYRQAPVYASIARGDVQPAGLLDLATISFNNPLVVHYQAKLLRKYLRDRYAYTVFDNSPPGPRRQTIRECCARDGIDYVELPHNPFAGNPSKDHGAALNWVCRRHFAARALPYLGFLDHDIFPCRATSIVDRLKGRGMFGRIDERGDRWYLWPGFCFFSRTAIRPERLNFLPIPGLDTGGGNWTKIYARTDRSSLPPVETTLENLREGGDKQSDMIERVDDWLHTINASEWKASNGKMRLVERLLSDL